MKTKISLSEEDVEQEPEAEDKAPGLPAVHYGSAESKPLEWRQSDPDESPDDDSELDETPRDVLSLIGFDPLKDD